jgi:hypothetical protein
MWGLVIERRLLVSLQQLLTISFVNKAQHRQHCLQCWGMNTVPSTSSALLLELCPNNF